MTASSEEVNVDLAQSLARWRQCAARNDGLRWEQWTTDAVRRARTARDELLLAGAREDVVRLAAGVEAVLALHALGGSGRCRCCSSWRRRARWPCPTASALFAGFDSAEDPIRNAAIVTDDATDPEETGQDGT